MAGSPPSPLAGGNNQGGRVLLFLHSPSFLLGPAALPLGGLVVGSSKEIRRRLCLALDRRRREGCLQGEKEEDALLDRGSKDWR